MSSMTETNPSPSHEIEVRRGNQRAELRQAIKAMMMTFTQRPAGDVDVITGAYAAILSDVPLDLALRAIGNIARGKVERNNAFPPSAPEIHAEADRLAREAAEHMRRLAPPAPLLLPEPEISAAERERIGQGFEDLKAELGKTIEQERAEAKKAHLALIAKANAVARARSFEHAGLEVPDDPLAASPELVALLAEKRRHNQTEAAE